MYPLFDAISVNYNKRPDFNVAVLGGFAKINTSL